MGWGGQLPGSKRCLSCSGKIYLPLSCSSEQITVVGPVMWITPAALLVFCGLAALCVLWHGTSNTIKSSSPWNLLSVCWDLCPQFADSCWQCTISQGVCRPWGCVADLSAISWCFTSVTTFRLFLWQSSAFLSLRQSYCSEINSTCCSFPLILVHMHTLKSWKWNMLDFPFVVCDHCKVASCNRIHIPSCNVLEKATESDFSSYFCVVDLFGCWVFSLSISKQSYQKELFKNHP